MINVKNLEQKLDELNIPDELSEAILRCLENGEPLDFDNLMEGLREMGIDEDLLKELDSRQAEIEQFMLPGEEMGVDPYESFSPNGDEIMEIDSNIDFGDSSVNKTEQNPVQRTNGYRPENPTPYNS